MLYRFPKYRLSKLLGQPGGKRIIDGINDAEASLKAINGDCVAYVETTLLQLETAWANVPQQFDRDALSDVYERANDLIGVAAVAGYRAMDRAAYSLCEVIDRTIVVSDWDREALNVHVVSLRLIRDCESGGQIDGLKALLIGLKQVRDRYAAIGKPAKPGSSAAPPSVGPALH